MKMSSLSSGVDIVSVTCGLKTYILRLCDSELFCIEHENIREQIKSDIVVTDESSHKLKRLHVDNEDLGLGLLCSDLSPCGNRLAFCTLTKNLCVLDITKSDVSVSRVYRLARGASKIKFTPKSKMIVVADKSGDVYIFNPEKDDVGQLILGHLSLLLDVLVTPDEQFIITCDRDEKIRVSNFPNAYNILGYCLGHSEFVSTILMLPHNDSCLISTSGDGTVRVWEYKVGTELTVCDTHSYLVSSDPNVELDEDVSLITDVTATFVNNSTSVVCVCLDHYKICLVLKYTSESGKLKYCLNQKISLDLSPWRVKISSNILWLISNSNDNVTVNAMMFDIKSLCFGDDLPEHIVKAVNTLNNQQIVGDFKINVVDLLYKRKFENVQEYLKKKDERCSLLQTCIKKSKT